MDYYLAPFRISKPTYVWHLLDIIRAPIGRPLLLQLAATPEKIADLLTAEPEQPVQVGILPFPSVMAWIISSSCVCLEIVEAAVCMVLKLLNANREGLQGVCVLVCVCGGGGGSLGHWGKGQEERLPDASQTSSLHGIQLPRAGEAGQGSVAWGRRSQSRCKPDWKGWPGLAFGQEVPPS